MKVSKKQIEDFQSAKKFALVGASRNPKKFGYQVIKDLSEKGYDIIPVNPKAESIMDIKCYPNISSLPKDIDSVVIMTKKDQTEKLVQEALSNNIKNIWIQHGSCTKGATELAENSSANVISNKCIFMFSDPDGFHNFHKNLVKFFGGLPK